MAKSSKSKKSFWKKEFHLPLPDNKVGGFLGKRVRGPKYFGESVRELKKVTWPSRKESVRLTIAVIIFTAVFTAFTYGADYVFRLVVERVFL